MFLYPYKMGSQSATDLANALGIKQIKREGSRFKGSPEKLVINWGNSILTEEVSKCMILNKPESVAICTDKLKFFKYIHNNNVNGVDNYVVIPWFTTSKKVATQVCMDEDYKIVCRTVLNGHSGEGIVIAEEPEQIVDAPLYVQYIPKKSEYRVHVFNGEVVDVQRKARDRTVPDEQVNWQVRNRQFGFIFVRDENIEDIPKHVLQNALNAVMAVGLDFGAVDVVYNQSKNTSHVLEVNTAPGLTGETLEGYRHRFDTFAERYRDVLAPKIKLKKAVPNPEAQRLNEVEGIRFRDILREVRVNKVINDVVQGLQPIPMPPAEQPW